MSSFPTLNPFWSAKGSNPTDTLPQCGSLHRSGPPVVPFNPPTVPPNVEPAVTNNEEDRAAIVSLARNTDLAGLVRRIYARTAERKAKEQAQPGEGSLKENKHGGEGVATCGKSPRPFVPSLILPSLPAMKQERGLLEPLPRQVYNPEKRLRQGNVQRDIYLLPETSRAVAAIKRQIQEAGGSYDDNNDDDVVITRVAKREPLQSREKYRCDLSETSPLNRIIAALKKRIEEAEKSIANAEVIRLGAGPVVVARPPNRAHDENIPPRSPRQSTRCCPQQMPQNRIQEVVTTQSQPAFARTNGDVPPQPPAKKHRTQAPKGGRQEGGEVEEVIHVRPLAVAALGSMPIGNDGAIKAPAPVTQDIYEVIHVRPRPILAATQLEMEDVIVVRNTNQRPYTRMRTKLEQIETSAPGGVVVPRANANKDSAGKRRVTHGRVSKAKAKALPSKPKVQGTKEGPKQKQERATGAKAAEEKGPRRK